tara:strand:+ start:51 stop:548 length:498 start_codon:yes stop_codon:yes gene_type:complete
MILLMRFFFNNLYFLFFLIVLTLFALNKSNGKGDLTRQKAISVEIFLKGKSGELHYFEPSILKFETGKLYKLKLINLSDSKHYFTSKKFVESIFTRKIQVNKNLEKIAEIKGNISEVEIFPNNTLEWWFVPIKTGVFEDLNCKVVDKKINKSHSEMGMRGKIIIN